MELITLPIQDGRREIIMFIFHYQGIIVIFTHVIRNRLLDYLHIYLDKKPVFISSYCIWAISFRASTIAGKQLSIEVPRGDGSTIELFDYRNFETCIYIYLFYQKAFFLSLEIQELLNFVLNMSRLERGKKLFYFRLHFIKRGESTIAKRKWMPSRTWRGWLPAYERSSTFTVM